MPVSPKRSDVNARSEAELRASTTRYMTYREAWLMVQEPFWSKADRAKAFTLDQLVDLGILPKPLAIRAVGKSRVMTVFEREDFLEAYNKWAMTRVAVRKAEREGGSNS